MRQAVLILLYIYVCLAVASGQEVNVSAVFDTSRICLGDQINFTVTVDKPVSYLLSVPVFRDTLQKNIEILNGPVTDTSFLKDGRIRIREKYLVTSFDSGRYQISPVYAEMRSETGIKRFYSDYALLEVSRVKIAPADTASKILDIIKPYKAPLTIGEILPWVLLILLVATGIWFLVRYIRKIMLKKSGEEPVINPDPAHIIAFRELEKLKEEKLWQKGEIKKYYTRLTEIVRQYLENRFRIFSMELTTVETLAELTKTGFKEDETYRILRTVLTGADLVKFAKYNPEPPENELHYEYAWDFVKSTKVEDQVSGDKIENEPKREEGT
jgi:hypothetical protein